MSIAYHIYSNTGAGDPVNYGSSIASTASLTWTSSVLAFPGRYLFAVRAYDTASGYSESNVDARLPLILDASGIDITSRPNSPANVSAIPTAGGGVTIHWTYSPLGQGGPPTGFAVYLTLGSSPGYSGSPTTVAYQPGRSVFSASISGLTDATTYTASVRAVNGTADDGGVTAYATFAADATGPAAVDGLGATVGA